MTASRTHSVKPDLERLAELIPRYDLAGPRYTSYPTAPAWQESVDAKAHREILSRIDGSKSALSLYVHVPFCRSLCHFCACNRVITQKPELPERYLAALEREVDAMREAFSGAPPEVGQIHLGGGTPTHLSPPQLERLFGALATAFPLRQGAEISIEVDPRVTTEAHMTALDRCGFNRISMGVQDFDPSVQAAIHRLQSVEEVQTLTERARASGFSGVNYDLIYGLPFQTERSFAGTLDTVIGLRPDRIALYSYAHVTWVAKQQRGFERHDLPGAEEKLRIMFVAIEALLAAGYEYIGMDHFALPEDELAEAASAGTLHRNFMGYTTEICDDLIAFGPSGISELSEGYTQSRREVDAWSDAIESEGLATFRGHLLTDEDRRRGWIIKRIMCQGEVDPDEYSARFGDSFVGRYDAELSRLGPLIEDGLVQRLPSGGLRVTDDGRLLVRNIAMVFDAYLPEQQQSGGRLFSRTV